MATKSTTSLTSTKKGLDEMSKAHRDKIERWEAHLPRLGSGPKSPAQHVWAQAPRFIGRGEGQYFVLVKVASKDYRIGVYDTSATKRIVFEAGQQFQSPKAALEAFKAFRSRAGEERVALRKAAKTTKTPKTTASSKTATKPKATRKVVRKPKSA